MPARPHAKSRDQIRAEPSRLLPLTLAGLVCFFLALALGYGGWYFFGSHRRNLLGAKMVDPPAISSTSAPTPNAPVTPPEEAPVVKPAPAGELPVPGGDIALGGEETGMPLRRELVAPFAIAETEVTNEQYREFVRETQHQAPATWHEGDFPSGTALEPVTGVTWQDAVDYCQWLSAKIGATVRLPTEAEWELAARGKERFKYPWGNEWDPRATASYETNGRVTAVKSYPAGKSPYGAYDMAGNVWEWLADEARDEQGQPRVVDGITLRVIKGGAAVEPKSYISATSRFDKASPDRASPTLGFRYVVLRGESHGAPQPLASPGG